MSRKAQALLELALFLGLMLMVLLAALSYQRNLREQRLTDKNVFEQAKDKAFKHKFIETDIDEQTWQGSGAIVSYSLNADRQANRIFQGGQRRTAASSASVYYSNAEDPPNLDYNYYNNTDIGPEVDPKLKKKIYYDRRFCGEDCQLIEDCQLTHEHPYYGANCQLATDDPEDDLKLSTADYISVAYPILSTLLKWYFNLEETGWWKDWGGYLDYGLRFAAFTYFAGRYYEALKKVNESEVKRRQLEHNDKQMGEWGWRVTDLVHDGEALAGKKYVKEVTAQVYDTETEETKNIDYKETQETDSSTRTVNVGHQVKRKISRRLDLTAPDPTIALNLHTFEFPLPAPKEVTVDLSGGQSETWN